MKAPTSPFLIPLLILGFFSFNISAYAQLSGSWQDAPTLFFDPRADFAASIVDNKIYTMGGERPGPLEVYDPKTGAWSNPTGTGLHTERKGLTAAAVNGKIYFIGGFNDSCTQAIGKLEVYDPIAHTWSTPVTTGTFTARAGVSSAVVGGKIYVMGGSPSDTAHICNLVEVFDPMTDSWSTPVTTGVFSPRWYFAAAVVGEKIYVMGGMDPNGSVVNTLEVFDPATNSWSMPITTGTFSPRSGLAAAVLDGKIFAFGGQNKVIKKTLEVFDPTTNSWATPMISKGAFEGRTGLTVSTVNDTIYALGGYVSLGKFGIITNGNQAFTLDNTTNPPSIGIRNNHLDFGSLDYLKDSSLHSMVLNPSSAGISIDSVMITGSGNFVLVGNTKEAALPITIAAGDSLGFFIKYTAPSATEQDSAIVHIYFDNSSDSVRTIVLIGSSKKPDQTNVSQLEKNVKVTVMVYPNPAESELRINCFLPFDSYITMNITDMLGKEVARLQGEEHEPGIHEILWDIRNLPSASYLLRLSACGERLLKVIEVLK